MQAPGILSQLLVAAFHLKIAWTELQHQMERSAPAAAQTAAPGSFFQGSSLVYLW
jgi:hypothetical protein